MTEAPDGDASIPVPDAEGLLRLGRDRWAVVLGHARAAMKELDDQLVTPRIERLRAVPVSKLADGRSRRDLCQELAEGGPVWRATAERLAADPEVEPSRLLSDAGPEPDTGPGQRTEPGDDSDERIHRLKERARAFRDERDDARRRADGLDARLRTEQERIAELEDELSSARDERDRLRGRLEAAAEDRREALDRLQRRHDAELHELREELRVHRRRQQQRERRRRRRQERRRTSEDAVEDRAAEQVEEYLQTRRHRRLAEAGRPSTLPAGVPPGTTEAADALLGHGRQVIIDGYNVTKQHRGHLALEQQRQWLTVRAARLGRRRDVRCVIVFDGDAAARSPRTGKRGVRVVFTADRTADDAIVQMVDDLPGDEPVLVVTDDRELRARAEERDADVLGTGPLVALLR